MTIPALTTYSILCTWSAGVVYFAIGAIFCTLSAKLAKGIIRQPRPPNPSGRKLKISYGYVRTMPRLSLYRLTDTTTIRLNSMPSTHATTISYYAAYIFLGCLYLPVHPTLPSGLSIPILLPLITLPCAITIVMSRVWLGHHTIPQVAAGVSCGVGFAFLWFALWINGLNSWGVHAEQNFNHWINETL